MVSPSHILMNHSIRIICVVSAKINLEYVSRKEVKPTIPLIYEKILHVIIKDVEHLNLFDGPDIPIPESTVWIWSRS